MSAKSDDRARIRDELLAEIVPRQPLLSVIHVIMAFLFVSGLANAAPPPMLMAWVAYMAVSQAIRLGLWYRHAAGRLSLNLTVWLVATSGAAGIGWGMIGALFADAGTPAQRMLVPFFLAGMAAGGVANLAGHLLVLYAFIVPVLLPYAVHLAMAGNPAARAMALTILAYGLRSPPWPTRCIAHSAGRPSCILRMRVSPRTWSRRSAASSGWSSGAAPSWTR
jgi:hypothetical protein